jgi:hypothetical protein
MTVYEREKIEDILNKYMWDLSGYKTNINIYNDLIKEVPELKHLNINLNDNLTIKEWAYYINKVVNLRILIENRNKLINSIIDG